MNSPLLRKTLCLTVIAVATAGCKDPEFAKAAAGMTQANAVIYDLAANDQQQLKTRMSDQTTADETIKQLSEEWAGHVRDLGAFKEISTVQTDAANEFPTVVASCTFEKGVVIAVVGLDADDNVRNVKLERSAQ